MKKGAKAMRRGKRLAENHCGNLCSYIVNILRVLDGKAGEVSQNNTLRAGPLCWVWQSRGE